LDQVGIALAGMVIAFAGVTAAAVLVRWVSQRRREAASLTAIDFVRSRFVHRLARGEPLDELLPDVVGALRDSLALDAAAIWLVTEAGELDRTASDPKRDPTKFPVPTNIASIVAGARVSGRPWIKVWLPELLPDVAETALRIAPIGVSGDLLGLITIERAGREERLAADADATLEELAAEVGGALRKQRLDTALQESMAQLRRQAQDLQASRARIVAAADAERRRIERDLHDGAQQYLVAIAVKAHLAQQLAEHDPGRARALLGELTHDTEAALDELRDLAHGIYPPLLHSGGLGEALSAACRRAGLPTELNATEVRRYPAELESAVYFCCLEALQNAAKYAGSGATASVALWEEAGGLLFEVRDDGAGFDDAHVRPGAGFTHMSDRLGAVGGRLSIESEPGQGTRVRGAIPLADVGDSTPHDRYPARCSGPRIRQSAHVAGDRRSHRDGHSGTSGARS
jgi:signal transduction histidine kinase